MRAYKFFWDTHRWTGILLSAFFLTIAVTGFLLLVKKSYSWIQPPTRRGTPVESAAGFLRLDQVFERVWAENHPAFRSLDDIDRIDFRPDRRVFKVRSKHDDVEVQVDLLTPVVDVDAYRDEANMLSEVLNVIEEISSDPELLMELAPDQLANPTASEEERLAYLSSLLNALDREAIVRLTREVDH